MNIGQRLMRILFHGFWAVFLTRATYFLGGAPLRMLRVWAGRTGYWAMGAGLSLAFYLVNAKLLAGAFFSLVGLMGVFAELEDVGLSFMVSGAFTLLINSLVGAGAFAFYVSRTGPKWDHEILSYLEASLKPLASLSRQFQIDYHDLLVQMPSVILMFWAVAIYLAVLMEARLNGGEPASSHGAQMRAQMAEFRLPDPVVWVFILSLLGAFGGFSAGAIEVLAVNAMNFCMLLLFFQGIAVVVRVFEHLRMGAFWQFLTMVLIVLHLFLFVSLLGLLDYWVDFRPRLSKRAEEFNREV